MVTGEETNLTYTGDVAADYHDVATLTAVLVDPAHNPAMPIASKPLTLSVGSQSCPAITNASGVGTCSVTLNQVPGPSTVSALFAGDAFFLPTSVSQPFTIKREETTLNYTGDTLIANGGTAHMAGVLLEDGTTAASPSGQTVVFTLGSGATAQSCSATTNTTGTVRCDIAPVAQPLGPGTVSASFAGDAFYLPSSDQKATLLFAFLARGSFVVGDRSAVAVGQQVTFWGARWARDNILSGGAAPSSFKGFASTLASAPPRCGQSWSSTPGNSPDPPDSVPSFMAVIVSSAASKSGPEISGDTSSIIVIQTNAGYEANPGHPGTGAIVASPSDPSVPARVCP